MKNRGFYIGRFQPYHNGHQSVLERIAEEVDEIVIGVGSAQFSHTVANPFTAGERVMMITRALEGLGCPYYVIPIEDIQRNALWVAHVRSISPPFDRVFTSNPLVVRLFHEQGIDVTSPDMLERHNLSGTEVRRRMIAGERWEELVPAVVAGIIEEIDGVARLQQVTKTD
ncbi:MAG TPA: nicotinamide-nucleotide adenylyltransferase [Methanoculleus sp.]|nr:nicotinamide-nucleotide adenylyltransferase [Methanoculleus sp.]